MSCTKNVGMGLFVQCLYALSLHLVSVVFGTAILPSLHPSTFFLKMFYLLVIVEFCTMLKHSTLFWSTLCIVFLYRCDCGF